jgi:hypothetical protein
MYAAVTVNFKVHELVRLLYLLIIASCVYKYSVNPITNPNPVYSYSKLLQYCNTEVGNFTSLPIPNSML